MPQYLDGFVLPVPKKKMAAYRRMAQKASRLWKEYGALDYKECAGDDLNVKMGLPFPRGIKSKAGETIVFRLPFTCTLGPGSYSVSPALVSSDTHLSDNYEWVDNLLVFDVLNVDRDFFIGSSSLDARFVIERNDAKVI